MKKPNIDLKKSSEPLFEKIEKLSKVQRILICSGIFLVIIGSFVYFSYLPKIKTQKNLNKQIRRLEKKLTIARKNARDLKKYQKKIKEAESKFKEVMLSLPEKEEIPSLISAVSASGKESGLEFLLFQPKGENRKDFYAEIPVSIQVAGNFHNIVHFFNKVARLSRIVNIRDIEITVPNEAGKDKSKNPATSKLSTSCTAVTYKFVEPVAKKKKPVKRGRRKK
ncbi:MAG: type 4a pilus biogenesis protein PilO [Thermodesulfobacteriota bacterium]|nr:type 4a pilus biogenesis protein PilO [Thermodesulfobacteriota bacterium]